MCRPSEREPVLLGEIAAALEAASPSAPGWEECVVESVVVCDRISDLLLSAGPGALLVTGLTQPPVVRSAEMLEAVGIVVVGGGRPEDTTMDLALQSGLPMLLSPLGAEECGRRLSGLELVVCRVGEQGPAAAEAG